MCPVHFLSLGPSTMSDILYIIVMAQVYLLFDSHFICKIYFNPPNDNIRQNLFAPIIVGKTEA